MSIQKAKDFLVHVATDESASAKLREAHEATLQKLGAELGYAFSVDDLRSAMSDMDNLDELSIAELQSLSGGMIRRRYADS